MTNIIINDKNRTIEISKKFANEAKKFGTEEYRMLQEARKDYPRYKVTVKAAAKRADSFKGLNQDYMLGYIKTHDKKDEQGNVIDNLSVFYSLTGRDAEGEKKVFSEVATYGELKKWFLEQYPEVAMKRENIDKILGKKKAALSFQQQK